MRKHTSFHIVNIVLTACVFATLITAYSLGGNKVVALVNGVAIEETALLGEVNKKLPMVSFHARVSEQKQRELRGQALQTLIEDELFFQEAKRQKLVVDRGELQKQMDLMKSGYGSEESFKREMAESGMSQSRWRERLARRVLIQQILKREVEDKVAVNESDLRNYYDGNKAKFMLPKRFKVRHILVGVEPGAMAIGWMAGQKKAEQVRARIKAGESFAALALEVSADSTSCKAGGSIGWFHQGQLLRELEETIASMKIGEVSNPVRTIYGFHILNLEATEAERQLSFVQIDGDALKVRLLKKFSEARRLQFLDSLRKRAEIRILDQ
jgi:parvulin-like peptidyl-prolyl isomerase